MTVVVNTFVDDEFRLTEIFAVGKTLTRHISLMEHNDLLVNNCVFKMRFCFQQQLGGHKMLASTKSFNSVETGNRRIVTTKWVSKTSIILLHNMKLILIIRSNINVATKWSLEGGKASSWDYVQKIKNNPKLIFTKFHQLTTYWF